MSKRTATIERSTKETQITLTLGLDGCGTSKVNSAVPFFDHMLDGFARHGFFDLDANIRGDVEVDSHHTIEDTGIVLGEAIKTAIQDKIGIKRYGHCILPMDETLILCAVDLSGRPYLGFECEYPTEMIGTFQTEMVREFFYAVSYAAGMNIHIQKLAGTNSHHIAEGTFKAFAKALDMAVTYDERIQGVLSTKGSL